MPAYDAAGLTAHRALAAYFEAVVQRAGASQAKAAANWVTGELASQLNRDGIDIAACPVSPTQLAALLGRIADGTVSNKMAKEIFGAVWTEMTAAVGGAADGDSAVDRIIEARGLKQISNAGELEAIIDAVLAANPKSVEEYRAGKEKAFNALVGQAMKMTRGKANPQQVNDMLKQKLA